MNASLFPDAEALREFAARSPVLRETLEHMGYVSDKVEKGSMNEYYMLLIIQHFAAFMENVSDVKFEILAMNCRIAYHHLTGGKELPPRTLDAIWIQSRAIAKNQPVPAMKEDPPQPPEVRVAVLEAAMRSAGFALRFYAQGGHYAGMESWAPSANDESWIEHPGAAGPRVENGSIARAVLLGVSEHTTA